MTAGTFSRQDWLGIVAEHYHRHWPPRLPDDCRALTAAHETTPSQHRQWEPGVIRFTAVFADGHQISCVRPVQ